MFEIMYYVTNCIKVDFMCCVMKGRSPVLGIVSSSTATTANHLSQNLASLSLDAPGSVSQLLLKTINYFCKYVCAKGYLTCSLPHICNIYT